MPLARSALLFCAFLSALSAADDRVVFRGAPGPGAGKRIVLVSGDEEYRSEEAIPQLARILSSQHGFDCTVLFAIDPASGAINPDVASNIPGLETLDTADLLVLFTRFRDLPDAQMKHVVDYVDSGRPIVALRTATHAFALKPAPRTAATVGTIRSGTAASAARCSAKPGSITTAVMPSRVPAP